MATRREKVVLDLEDNFTAGMLRAAAATGMLDKSLHGIDKSSVSAGRSVQKFSGDSDNSFNKIEQQARRAERSSSLLVDSIVMLGPALVPLGAAAVPAVAGLTSQLGFAAAAGGVAVLAFQGIGDALKSVSDYQLEPTAAHLAKMREEMGKIGPAGRDFVRELERMKDLLKPLQDTARAGLFPGLTAGLESLTTRIPQVQRIINQIATQSGTTFAQMGDSLASGSWDDFFNFLEREAAPTLSDLGETIGNLAHTAANLWVAFEPLENSFSAGLVSATQDLQDWSEGLGRTQGFHDFVDYVQQSGPQVAEALGKLANAFVQVVQAAAPMGGPILKILGTFADLVAALADSPLGTPLFTLAAGLTAVNRAMIMGAKTRDSFVAELLMGRAGSGGRGPNAIARSGAALQGFSATTRQVGKDMGVMATSFGTAGAKSQRESARIAQSAGRLKSSLSGIGKSGALLGGLTLATSGVTEGMFGANTASMALMGTIAGPWGAAIGGGIGLVMDMTAAVKNQDAAERAWAGSLKSRTTVQLQASRADLEAEKAAIRRRTAADNLVSTGAGYGASRQKDTFSNVDAGRLAAINKELAMRDAKEGAANLGLLRNGMIGTAAGVRVAGESLQEFQQRVLQLNDVLSGRAGLRDYQASLDDLRQSLKDNGKTLDINSAKGRANQAALDNIAGSALKVAETMKGVERVKFLSNARKSFIDAAVAAGRTRKEAGRLADRLLGLNLLKPKPKVDLDKSRADAKRKQVMADLKAVDRARATPKANIDKSKFDKGAGAVRGALAAINGSTATAHVRVEIGSALGAISAVSAGLNALDGQTAVSYTKTVKKKAGGGWVFGAGTSTSDSIPALLSNGEHVTNAAAAAMYPRELEWINAQGLRHGGYAGAAPPVHIGGSNNTYLLDLGDLGGIVEVRAREVTRSELSADYDMAGSRRRAGTGSY